MGGQFFDQFVVYLGVHLGLQDLLCTGDGKSCYLAAQLVPGTVHFLFDLGAGAGDQSLAFHTCLLLGFLDDRVGVLVRLLDDLGCLLLGLAEGVDTLS